MHDLLSREHLAISQVGVDAIGIRGQEAGDAAGQKPCCRMGTSLPPGS